MIRLNILLLFTTLFTFHTVQARWNVTPGADGQLYIERPLDFDENGFSFDEQGFLDAVKVDERIHRFERPPVLGEITSEIIEAHNIRTYKVIEKIRKDLQKVKNESFCEYVSEDSAICGNPPAIYYRVYDILDDIQLIEEFITGKDGPADEDGDDTTGGDTPRSP